MTARHDTYGINSTTIATNLAIWLAILPGVVDQSLYNAARVNVSLNAFFSSRSEKKFFDRRWNCGKKENEMWFSVVCTLIDYDTRHSSGQNVLWTHEAQPPKNE